MSSTNKKILLITLIFCAMAAITGITYFSFIRSTVTIKSTIEGAAIVIDSKKNIKPGQTVTLGKGDHIFAAKSEGYEDIKQSFNLKRGENKNINLQFKLKTLSKEEFKLLSPEEQKDYEARSDHLADFNERTLRENNPIVQQLPHIDPEGGFRVDYGGDIYKATIIVTYYGGNQEKAQENKEKAIRWINYYEDASKLNINFIDESFSS